MKHLTLTRMSNEALAIEMLARAMSPIEWQQFDIGRAPRTAALECLNSMSLAIRIIRQHPQIVIALVSKSRRLY